MSRFSPTVLPNSGAVLAQALGQGVESYLRTRRQTREDKIADELRQRGEAVQNAQLGEQGIHLTAPGELPPQFDVNVTGGPNPDAIVSHAMAPSATPAPTGQPLSVALSRHLSSGPGFYIDRDEQADAAKRTASAQMAQILAQALAKGQADEIVNPGGKALARALTESEITKNNRAPVVPPPRIDPLSPQGIAAQRGLEAYKASLRPQAVGPDGVPIGKPSSDNLKNAAFLNIAKAEDPALADMGATVASSALSRIPLIGNTILKHTDPKFQAQQLAGDRWIMQWLRSTSGAAIGKDELDNYRKQYIPQAGDTPQTIAAKAKARADVEKSLATMAGPAGPHTGNVDLRQTPGGDTAGRTITVNGKTFRLPD